MSGEGNEIDSSEHDGGSATEQEFSHEEIARLAYSYWETRKNDSAESDWLRAKAELRFRINIANG